MGGSKRTGGHLTVHDMETLRQQAEERLAQRQLSSEVNSLLLKELTSINDRDTEQINSYLESIRTALGDRIAQVDRLLFGGSVAKHTFVDGLSDIDALVLLSEMSLSGSTPDRVIRSFAQSLREVLPRGNVEAIREGSMAVTVRYLDGTEIQLLPAITVGNSVAIPSSDGRTWSTVNPSSFATELTRVNQRQGNGVVPAIKLAKSILSSKLGDSAPSGHHVEALAVAAFREYSGRMTPMEMLTHLIADASKRVLTPISDITNQTRYVDNVLGARNSRERRSLSRSLTTLAKRMENAHSVADWREILD